MVAPRVMTSPTPSQLAMTLNGRGLSITPPFPFFMKLERAYDKHDRSLTYISDGVVLFWYQLSAFSQWTPLLFIVDLVESNYVEQFMMAPKARLFRDDAALSAIFASDDPQEQRHLGRQVRHFHPTLWPDECKAMSCEVTLQNYLIMKKCVLP